ncbi:MAG TPA: peptidoglycan editing factor PgeF [Candidatus Eisenbacteria bacterium]|nr:peptidoglycan editing factor PgeF [Candidatus Eisenbacteria bacterium]
MTESYEIITVDGVRYIRIPELLEAGLNHVFTTSDLNMTTTGPDVAERLTTNLEKVYEAMEIYPSQFYFMEQRHTDWVSVVDEEELGRKQSFGHRTMGMDGLITSQHEFALCSTAADCVPVLLYDPVKKVHANIHSGWQGTVKKIAQRAIKNMKLAYDIDPKNLIIGIGPHIAREDYEIQDNVAELYHGVYPNHHEIIFKSEDGKRTLDLAKAIETTLVNEGVLKENIYNVNLNTYKETELLHSYRRQADEVESMAAISSLLQAGEYVEVDEDK